MGSFGESLRRERELRGVTLPELANSTKINPRYLRALEEDNFEILPGGIFGRGFVRSVCRYMKLDEEHWVGEFARAANAPPETLANYVPVRQTTVARTAGAAKTTPDPNGRSSARTRWSFVLLVALFGAAAYAVHDVRVQRAAEAAQPHVAVASPASATAQPEAEGELPPPSSQPEQTTAAAVPVTGTESFRTAASELNLQIDVINDAWLRVRADGATAFEATLKAGESRSVNARERIELLTGSAGAVVLTLNGETLAPLGNPGERKTVVLTATDLHAPKP